MELCPSYWALLEQLAREGRVFVCDNVYQEIQRQDDELAHWLKDRKEIFVRPFSESVAKALSDIYRSNPNHAMLVSEAKGRSAADPFVIAHAIANSAVVVTKEKKSESEIKPKIPNVCENMQVVWIDDIQMLKELRIGFEAFLRPED
jgi:predicted nucleic acid-binding protein